MNMKWKFFLLSLCGLLLPHLCFALASAGFLHVYLAMGLMVICLMLLVYNGSYGAAYGKTHDWGNLWLILFLALNLLPALYYAFTLFPAWMEILILA